MAKVNYAEHLREQDGVVGKFGRSVYGTGPFGPYMRAIPAMVNQPNSEAQLDTRLGIRYSGMVTSKITSVAQKNLQTSVQLTSRLSKGGLMVKYWNHLVTSILVAGVSDFTAAAGGTKSVIQNLYDTLWSSDTTLQTAWDTEATNRQWASFDLGGTSYNVAPYNTGLTPGFWLYNAVMGLYSQLAEDPGYGPPDSTNAANWAAYFLD